MGAMDETVTFNHAREAVTRLTQAGIEPVGIGILEPCVRSIFPRSAVIQSLEHLPGSFLKELSAVLTRTRTGGHNA